MFKLKTGAAANTCACNAGYSGNGRSSCEEVDGCLFKNGGCDELHASCTKVHTTKYICKCQEGWTGNGKKCTQIEACSVEHGGCADMATCAREAGGGANTSACKCNAGFEGDGSICTPVNPCAPTAFGIAEAEMKNMTLKYPCSSFAKCNSAAPGDHTCACNNGYSGDGKECAEVDMCGDPSIMNCSKHATCTQLKPGKAECTCKQYYLGDGRECNITCELKEFECRHGALLDMDKCKCVKCPAPWTGETCNICTRAGTYPALDLCVNGGRLDKSTCKCIDCPPPWSGELCNVCPYKPEDCLGRGTLNTKTCRCDACAYPWAGKMCDRCELKKTDCRLEYHSFAYVEPQNCECTNCTRGWGGPNCNECTLNRCKHGGKVSKTSCNCYYCNDGWMGDYCETCGLTQSHCLHGGKLNEETCQCESCKGGWGGQTCNACNFTQADCKSGTFDVDDCTCKQCNALMGGDLCEICERSDAECGHGGQMDGSTCQCMYCEAPWTGENCTKCPIQQSQCKHGSTLNKGACNCFPCQSNGPVDRYCDECKLAQKDCKNQGTFDRTSCSCKCKGQWSGDICNACPVTDKTCVNGTWSDKLCKCVCTASYSGSKCNECALDSCEHGAVLDKSGCRCKCNAPWTGPSCGVCLLTDKACKNGGKVDPVLCQCIDCDSEPNELSVWAGLLCDKCQLRKDTCKHGAVLNPDTCTCDKCNFNVTHAFWKGDRCNTCIPEDLDLCTRNGGSKDFAKCKCACPMDFAGKYCEKKACPRDPSTFWECSTNPDPEATDEHGLCMRNSEEQTSKCKCNIPWGGPACSQLGERTYCSMRGLSHGTNFDGARFDYPSTGEFVFARYTQDPSEETVHITKMKLGDRSMSSVVSGLAIKRNDATVSFVVDTHKREIDNLEKNADIYYECSTKTSMLMKYSDVVAGAEKGYTFPNGVKVAAAGNRYIITTDSGTVIWLNKVNTATAPIEKVQSFLLHMSISQPKGGYMEGVCGNFDGQNDQTDDFLPKYIVAKDESLFECAQPSPKAVFSRMSITDRYGAIDRDPDDRDVMPTSVGYCATEEKQRKGAPEVCCDMCKKYASEGVSECDDCKKDYCLTGLSGVANMAQSSFEEFTAFHKEVIELKSQDHKFGEELKSKKKVVGGTELR